MRYDAETASTLHLKARCTPAEREVVAAAAHAKGQTVSDFIRIAVDAALPQLPDLPMSRQERCLYIDAAVRERAAAGLPPIITTLFMGPAHAWTLRKTRGEHEVASLSFRTRGEALSAAIALIELGNQRVIIDTGIDRAA